MIFILPGHRLVVSPFGKRHVSLNGKNTSCHPPLEYLQPLDLNINVLSVAYATIKQ